MAHPSSFGLAVTVCARFGGRTKGDLYCRRFWDLGPVPIKNIVAGAKLNGDSQIGCGAAHWLMNALLVVFTLAIPVERIPDIVR